MVQSSLPASLPSIIPTIPTIYPLAMVGKGFRSSEHHVAAEEITASVPARGHTSMFFPLSLIILFYFFVRLNVQQKE